MNFIRRIGYDAGATTPLEAERMAAARDRLLRAADHAEAGSVSLFFENLNRAPDAAAVHCLGHTR